MIDEGYIKEKGFPFPMLFITTFLLVLYVYIDFSLIDPLESLFNFIMFSIRWLCFVSIIRTFFKEEESRKRLNETIREINEIKRKMREGYA